MSDDNQRILGVLGGMGPLASAHFMLRLTALTPVSRDQDHIPTVLWSDPRIPDRTEAKLRNGLSPLPALLRGINGLKQAGCNAIAIPCNTAHGWYDEMAQAAGIPILHIVDAAATELENLGIASGRVGLMGTQGTLAMQLYQQRLKPQGWECVVPNEEEMQKLVTPAIAQVKANKVVEAYEPLAEIATRLYQRGAQAVILGCTEIPLGIQAGAYQELGFPLVDTIDALAKAAIGWARPELVLEARRSPSGQMVPPKQKTLNRP